MSPKAEAKNKSEAPVDLTPKGSWKSDIYIFVGLFLAAFVLRVIALGRADLWQDEMLFVNLSNVAQMPSQVWSEYWNRYLVSMAWLPLPGVVLNAFMRYMLIWVPDVMYNLFWVRIPGAVFGSLAVSCSFFLFRLVAKRDTVLTATLFMCCTVFPLFYSRELHAYPLLLLLATATTWFYFQILTGSNRKRYYLLFGLSALLMLYTHLTATMYYAALCAVLLGVWAWTRFREGNRDEATRLFRFGLFCAAVGCCVIPVFMRVLGGESPHMAETSALSLGFVLNDAVSKLFLGDHLIPSILAWVFLLLGIWRMGRAGKNSCAAMSVAILSVVFIALSAMRTQYLSVRYFTAGAPLLLLVFAAGFFELGDRLDRLLRIPARIKSAWFVAGGVLGIHLFVFLPPIYRLEAKSVDFGRIATWLNENVPQGAPYVMNSAYELRLIPGYFDTPGRVAVSPYVHGPGPAELERLHRYQQGFLLAFPEAPYVESDGDPNPWMWPREHFAQQVRLTNEPLRRIIKMGIYPTLFRHDLRDESLTTTINVNSLQDRLQKAAANNINLVLEYPGSTATPVSQAEQGRATLYARAWPGPRAHFQAHVRPNRKAVGSLRFSGVVMAPPGEYNMEFLVGDKVVQKRRIASGRLVEWDVPLDLEKSGRLGWYVAAPEAASVQGVGITSIRFEEKPPMQLE